MCRYSRPVNQQLDRVQRAPRIDPIAIGCLRSAKQQPNHNEPAMLPNQLRPPLRHDFTNSARQRCRSACAHTVQLLLAFSVNGA